MFPNYWPNYDSGYPSLDCFDEGIPDDLDLPKPEFENFIDSPVNGFSNSIEFPSDDFDSYSWLPHEYSFNLNRPLPPISTFFENTRNFEEEVSTVVFNEVPPSPNPYIPVPSEPVTLPQVPIPEVQPPTPQPATCAYCDKVLPSPKSLKHHICMTHQIIDKACTFEFCSYVSKTRKEYNTHVRQHNLMSIHERKRERISKVKVNYSIRNQRELEVYLKTCPNDIIDAIHQQQKDLLVQRTNIASMNLYIEYNFQDKKWTFKYTCIGCSKEFARDYNAKRHSEKHSTRNVVCPFCDRMVRGSMALKTHITKYHQISE
ncbi:unnamed protein product [Auanema sp. JU1783]|nr:unnamed protein product [Auanema sp. JU1783]